MSRAHICGYDYAGELVDFFGAFLPTYKNVRCRELLPA
jgi:hypothetical protein